MTASLVYCKTYSYNDKKVLFWTTASSATVISDIYTILQSCIIFFCSTISTISL